MIISSSELKSAVKKISAAKTEHVIWDFAAGKMTAANLDLVVEVTGLPTGISDKSVLVNARKLTAAINRMSGDIDIIVDKSLTLKSARATVQLEILPAKAPAVTPTHTSQMSLALVRSLLQYSAIAADPNRASNFGGVVQLSTVVGGIEEEKVVGLQAIGTNGQRQQTACEEFTGTPINYLIPLPAVTAILALEGTLLELGSSEKQLFFRSENVSITASKMVKEFPDCSRFAPKEFKYVFQVEAEAFKSVLRTAELMIDPATANACSVCFLDNALTVRSIGVNSSAEDSCEFTQISPDPIFESVDFSALLNHKYLSDFVTAVSGPVTISANSSTRPFVFKAGRYQMLVAPTVEK